MIDVLVSVGTARNADKEEKLNASPIDVRQQMFSRINNILKLVKNQIQVNLETERMWEDLVRDETIPRWQRQRFHRLNPDIGYGPPELDAVLEMTALMNNTSKVLNDTMREPIRLAARELVASCFYFQQSSYTWKGSEGLFKCEGTTFPTRPLPIYLLTPIQEQFAAASPTGRKPTPPTKFATLAPSSTNAAPHPASSFPRTDPETLRRCSRLISAAVT